MKHHLRRILACALMALMLFGIVPAPAAAASFTDVPAGSWAEKSISRCVAAGLFQGETATRFGMGKQMTRAAFTVVLCRFFGWELATPTVPTYDDVQNTAKWYYSAVETAYAHGAITRQTETFRPDDPITREEMAVMLVRALGYTTLAGQAQELELPFTDVTTNAGYIALAYDMGIINGTSDTTFSPDRTATREQAAVMLMRLYDKYHAPAPSRIGIAAGAEGGDWTGYEAVVVTGGRLAYSSSVQVTRPAEEREKKLLKAIDASGAQALLHVTGSNASLKGKVKETATALLNTMREAGYDGLYLDFPQLNAASQKKLVQLLEELKDRMNGASLYVEAEAPAWGTDAAKSELQYDKLAAAADRLVLRVAPYKETAGGFAVAPVEPLQEVYYAFSALRELVSAEKLGLLLTTPATVWKGSKQEGTMTPAEIEAWLADEKPTQQYYSDRYACAYLTRKEGTATIAVWYLNGEAAAQRAQLCGLFGVDQVCFSDLDAVSAEVLAGLEK